MDFFSSFCSVATLLSCIEFSEVKVYVPRKGLEPSRRKALVPKTSVSTNSTPAAIIYAIKLPTSDAFENIFKKKFLRK